MRASKSQLLIAVEQQLTGGCWNPPKNIPHIQRRRRSCLIMIASNLIAARWMNRSLENNNTKEVRSLLWRFWALCQASQPRDPVKGLGLSREYNFQGQWDLITGETEAPLLEGTNKNTCASTPRGKEQWLHRILNQMYLLVLEGLLWRKVSTVACYRDRYTGSSSPEWCSLVWALLDIAINSTKETPVLGCLRLNS